MRRLLLPLLLAGCGATAAMDTQPEPAQRAQSASPQIIAQWNHRPEADAWNTAMMEALLSDGRAMVEADLEDAQEFCPNYTDASPEERAAFFVAFFSGLARYESTWNPRAAGAGGLYQGLLQIDPRTAGWHNCELGEDGLYDGADNLRCAVRIANAAVTRDGVVANGPRGIAADWPPMRDSRKRTEVAEFTRALPQC